MKRIIILILTLLSLTLLSGCDVKFEHSENVVENDAEFSIGTNTYELDEWISPDGVHYWVCKYSYYISIAPRYDNEGNLVIDDTDHKKAQE